MYCLISNFSLKCVLLSYIYCHIAVVSPFSISAFSIWQNKVTKWTSVAFPRGCCYPCPRWGTCEVGPMPWFGPYWDVTNEKHTDTWEDPHGRANSSEQSVTRASQDQVLWRSMRGSTQERSLSNARSVTRASRNQTTYRILRGPKQERSYLSA